MMSILLQLSLALAAALAGAPAGSTGPPPAMDVSGLVESDTGATRIRVVVDPFPNYLFHLLSAAGVGYEPSGASEAWLPPGDRAMLVSHGDLIAFADAARGPLSVALVFLPLYLNPEDPAALDRYFERLDDALRTGDAGPFVAAYRERLERIRLFLPFRAEPYLESIGPLREEVAALGRIVGRNYRPWLEGEWPALERRLEPRAEALRARLAPLRLVDRWERATGARFKTATYEIALCAHCRNGPDAVSAGYDRNHLFAGRDLEYLVQFISHETGTHVLIDAYGRAMSAGLCDPATVYAAYESLALFYNRRLMDWDPFLMAFPEYESDRFADLYTAALRSRPDAGPDELLRAALERLAESGTGAGR